MKDEADQLIQTLKQYNKLITVIKGSPDPDAIASSFTFKLICDHLEIKNNIFSEKKISLPQNKAMVDRLDIPIRFSLPPDIDKYEGYMIFDHQSATFPGISEKLPCIVHIDHHEKSEDTVQCKYSFLTHDAGSASTIISLLIKEMDLPFSPEEMRRISTALLYGIETDTDKYTHAGDMDYEAIEYVSKHANSAIIKKINGIPIPKDTIHLLWRAMENMIIYKEWLIAGIGYVTESRRDSIAVIADFLLKREDPATVIVFAVIKKEESRGLTLDASFRSTSENIDLNAIIKEITPEGGARKYKGAFQVNLDFFSYYHDKEVLWKIISETTIEALKKSRDELYITEIKSYYHIIKEKFTKIIKK